jgi:GDSL-like lipase/acylhydrolase family protein
MSRVVLVVSLLLAVAADARPLSPRFRRMVAIGDSLFAGFSSGGFVARGRAGQRDSAPAMIARRARAYLPQPLISKPGVPPQLRIVDANGNRRLDAGEVRRRLSGLGFRKDADVEVRNLAVPGEDMTSLFEEITPSALAAQLVTGDVSGPDALKLLILGVPLRDTPVSQVTRARELRPTFALVWIGNNEVLSMATRTQPGVVSMTPEEFGRRITQLLDSLADTQTDVAIANLPDPTAIAALRHAAGEVTGCRPEAGAVRPVAADDLMSIDQDPASLPTPPCNDVLDADERAAVRATVQAFNAALASAVTDVEARRGIGIALVDVFAGVDLLRQSGADLDGDGVPDLTTGYLGGIFSLDGIHPTRSGNALVADLFIDAIDARFGERIPRVDVARVAAHDPLVGSRFRPVGEAPFGLIGDSSSDEVKDFFEGVGRDIEDGLDDLRDHFAGLL